MAESDLLRQFLNLTEYDYPKVGQYFRSQLPCKRDDTFSRLCALYRQAASDERCTISQFMDMYRSAWLSVFAYRLSMLTARHRSETMMLDALTAMLVIARNADRHSFLQTLSLVYHSAAKLGDAEKIFTAATRFACDVESANLVVDFAKRAPENRRIEAMGFREIEGKSGIIYLQVGEQELPEGWM